MRKNTKQRVVLCIMDGWGINKNSNHNAVALAKTPNVDYLTFPDDIGAIAKVTGKNIEDLDIEKSHLKIVKNALQEYVFLIFFKCTVRVEFQATNFEPCVRF